MKNLYIFDAKMEMAPQVVPAIQKLGFNTICINPEEAYKDRGCSPANVNVNECIIDAMYSDDPKIRSLTSLFIKDFVNVVAPPANEKTSGGSAFFKDTGQDTYAVIKSYNISTEPEMATPAHEYRILSDLKHTREILHKAVEYRAGDTSNPIVNDMRRISSSVLEIIKEKPEYFPQFTKVGLDGLRCFDESGNLSKMGEYAVTRISDVRTNPRTVLINMTPLHLLEHYEVFNSLVAYNVFAACMVHRNGHPVHAIIEEFNAIKIPSINKKLNTLRGLKFTAEMYVQSRFGIINAYDELTAKEIEVNSDISHYMACNTFEEARATSELIGTKTIRTSSASVKENAFEDIGQSFQDTKISILSPQDMMSLPSDDQIIKIRGMRPIYAKKLKHWEIEGLRELIASNPLEGVAPKVPAKIGIKISSDRVQLLYPNTPYQFQFMERTLVFLKTLFHPRYFLWLFAWVFIGGLYQLYGGGLNLPIMLYEYTSRTIGAHKVYENCRYISITGEKYQNFASRNCPFITFPTRGL